MTDYATVEQQLVKTYEEQISKLELQQASLMSELMNISSRIGQLRAQKIMVVVRTWADPGQVQWMDKDANTLAKLLLENKDKTK